MSTSSLLLASRASLRFARSRRGAKRRTRTVAAEALCAWLALGAAAQALVELGPPTAPDPGREPAPADSTVEGNTGTAHWRVPIELPPGAGGFRPVLALEYSSRLGDGPFGVGWQLATGEVRCATRFGVPAHVSAGGAPCPRFELDGELLNHNAAEGRYHTFVESFQRVVHVAVGGDDHWEVTSPDGITRRYGTSADSRVLGPGGEVVRWLLAETENPHGQKIHYVYDGQPDTEPADPPGAGFPYLSRVSYGPGLAGPEREVRLDYETRPDPVADRAGGVSRRIDYRAHAIEVRSHGLLHSRIRLGWDLAEVGEAPTAADYATERSRLSWVQREGSDGSALPAQQFRYSDASELGDNDGDEVEGLNWEVSSHVAGLPAGFFSFDVHEWAYPTVHAAPVRTGDLDGDGLLDILRFDQSYGALPGVWRNTGDGFEPDAGWLEALQSLRFQAPRVDVTLVSGNPDAVCGASYSEVSTPVYFGDTRFPLPLNFQFPWSHETGVPDPAPFVQIGGNFHLVDLNADGRVDLLMSIRLSGIHVTHDCAGNPLPEPQFVEPGGRHARVAFRNTGHGWVEDPTLAEGLPAFGVVWVEGGVGFDEIWNGGDTECWDLTGPYWAPFVPNFTHAVYPCLNYADLAPQFHDLNGDGRLDLIAAAPDSPQPTLLYFSRDVGGDPFAAQHGVQTHSRAWISGAGGWQRAPSFDLPFHHVDLVWGLGEQGETLLSTHDGGVRLVDRNRDGFTDVTWVRPFEHPGYASAPRGVLINRGGGDGRAHSAWCASRPIDTHPSEAAFAAVPVCADADRVARLELPEGEHFVFEPWEFNAGTELSDLNGDGWLDLVRAGRLDQTDGRPPTAFLFSPAGAPWREDERFEPPTHLGVRSVPDFYSLVSADGRLVDLDGNGSVDFIRGDGNGRPESSPPRASWVGRSGLADLLREVRNGRGGRVEIQYAGAAGQRLVGLEYAGGVDAVSHGEAPGEGDPVRWSAEPVVASVTVEGPNREPAETLYLYAHPRWCVEHRTSLGYRVVRKETPDGGIHVANYYQHHGRAGKTSRRVVTGVGGPLRREHEHWELPDPASVAGAWAGDALSEASPIGRLAERTWQREYGAYLGERTGAVQRERFVYDDTHGHGFVAERTVVRPSGTHVERRTPWVADPLAWIHGLVATREIGDPWLQRVDYTYTPEGRVETESVALERRDGSPPDPPAVTHFEYDPYGNLAARVDPLGRRTEYCHDGNVGGLSWCQSPPGQSSGSVLVGRLDPAVDGETGVVTSIEPHPAFGAPVRVEPGYLDSPTTSAVLDPFGRLVERWVEPEGGLPQRVETRSFADHAAPPYVETHLYADAAGNALRQVEVSDGFGGTWKEVRDADVPGSNKFVGTATWHRPAQSERRSTLPIACADPLCTGLSGALESAVEVVVSDPLGRPLSRATPRGSWLWHYRGAVEPIVEAPGAVASHAVDVALEQNARGDLTRRSSDGKRLLAVEACTNSDPQRSVLEGVSCQAAGDPIRSLYGYHANGQLEVVYDVEAVASSSWHDPRHRLRHHFDTAGRVIRVEDPDAGGLTSHYDAAGNLLATENAAGKVRSYEYDGLDRPTAIRTPAPEPDHALSYRAGQLQLAEEISGAYRRMLDYDDFGRVRRERVIDAGRTLRSNFEYDLLGRRTGVNRPASSVLYVYAGAFLKRICAGSVGAGCVYGGVDYVSDVEYDELGRHVALHTPGGVRRFEYSADDRRHRVRDAFEGAAGWLALEHTSHDALGNPLDWSTSGNLGGLEASGSYAYDARNRLAAWERNGETRLFAYDALGNRSVHAGASSSPNQLFADPERPHALTRRLGGTPVDFGYDATGNLASATRGTETTLYIHDSANRLVCVIGPAGQGCDLLRVYYDSRGWPVREQSPSGTRRFLSDDFLHISTPSGASEFVTEIRAFGERVASVTWRRESTASGLAPTPFGVEPPPGFFAVPPALALAWIAWLAWRGGVLAGIARRPGYATLVLPLVTLLALPAPISSQGAGATTTHRWFMSDPTGSGISVFDEAGALVRHTRFTPFGDIDAEMSPGAMPGRRRYADHPRQVDTGLVAMRARWMDPLGGAFLSVDPVARTTAPRFSTPTDERIDAGIESEAFAMGGFAEPEEPAVAAPAGHRPPPLARERWSFEWKPNGTTSERAPRALRSDLRRDFESISSASKPDGDSALRPLRLDSARPEPAFDAPSWTRLDGGALARLLAESPHPYAYALDNPLGYVDPDGEFPLAPFFAAATLVTFVTMVVRAPSQPNPAFHKPPGGPPRMPGSGHPNAPPLPRPPPPPVPTLPR